MVYKVLLHPKAKIFLEKLDEKIRKRIKYKLKELERFPDERGKHLKYSTFWSLGLETIELYMK